jgi:type II secretory pathway pseudopilin PulG
MTARPRNIPARGGFTLLEVLISVGIVVLLGALVLTAVIHARTTGYVIRTRSDLGLIGTALSAYKADFGDYPRFAPPPPSTSSATPPTDPGAWINDAPDRGARLLCRALIGPAGGTTATPEPGEDGAPGPGFRIRRTLVTGTDGTQQLGGRVYGPYLQADRWKLAYDPNPASATGGPFSSMYNAKMLDIYGHPILYYPATPGGASRIRQPGGFVANYPGSTIYPLYNASDNARDLTPPLASSASTYCLLLDPTQMAFILGDRSVNGSIDAGESAVTTQPYLLWSAGADGKFGFGPTAGNLDVYVNGTAVAPPSTTKIDDICNFDIPADLRN